MLKIKDKLGLFFLKKIDKNLCKEWYKYLMLVLSESNYTFYREHNKEKLFKLFKIVC